MATEEPRPDQNGPAADEQVVPELLADLEAAGGEALPEITARAGGGPAASWAPRRRLAGARGRERAKPE